MKTKTKRLEGKLQFIKDNIPLLYERVDSDINCSVDDINRQHSVLHPVFGNIVCNPEGEYFWHCVYIGGWIEAARICPNYFVGTKWDVSLRQRLSNWLNETNYLHTIEEYDEGGYSGIDITAVISMLAELLEDFDYVGFKKQNNSL